MKKFTLLMVLSTLLPLSVSFAASNTEIYDGDYSGYATMTPNSY